MNNTKYYPSTEAVDHAATVLSEILEPTPFMKNTRKIRQHNNLVVWPTVFLPSHHQYSHTLYLVKLESTYEYTFLSYRVHHLLEPYKEIPIHIFHKIRHGQ